MNLSALTISPALLGLGMILTFMTLIMTKRLSAVTALIVVPIGFGLLAGAGAGLGNMMIEGVVKLAPTALMLAFAVLYFGIMIDAGLFDPLVRLVLRLSGDDPVKITVGTALLAMGVALDGDGATTALVTISAMLPVYRRLQLNPLILGLLLGLSSAVMNILPWGGPTARAASALGVEISDVFLPMLPAMLAGCVGIVLLAWFMGVRERRRLATRAHLLDIPATITEEAAEEALSYLGDPEDKRPRLIWVNLALTIGLMAGLLLGLAPMPALVMGAFAIALCINYPDLVAQRRRLAAHAQNVVGIVLLIFAAGAFTGILSGTGMVTGMADAVVAAIPPHLGPYMAPITSLVSLPLTFVMSNDAFYFGILPVIAETGAQYGVPAEAIARASLVGLPVHALSPLIAAIYLVCGMLKVEVGDAQRFSFGWALLAALLLFCVACATGAIPWRTG